MWLSRGYRRSFTAWCIAGNHPSSAQQIKLQIDLFKREYKLNYANMVLALAMTAELNGVTDLLPKDTEDAPFYYTFKVQCTSCRETHPNPVSLSRFEMNEVSGSRGEANFVWRCKNCKREHSATITAPPASYEQQDPPKAKNILTFDCRGLEFTEFKADGEWIATGAESGTKFTSIELHEGEWFDYDEKAGEEVSITNIKWEIRRG